MESLREEETDMSHLQKRLHWSIKVKSVSVLFHVLNTSVTFQNNFTQPAVSRQHWASVLREAKRATVG